MMTDEEVQRAMEERTPVVVPGNNGRQVVGVIGARSPSHDILRRWLDVATWSVQLGESDSVLRRAAEIRLATAEELLVEGDE